MKTTVSVVALCLISSAAAHADTKAWSAAKKVIPAHEQAVIGVNFASARNSQLYQMLVPMAIAKSPEASAQMAEVKEACGIDPLAAIDSVVLGVSEHEDYTVVIAFNNITRPKLESCMTEYGKKKNKPLTITPDGQVVKYSHDGKDAYVRWLGPDVLAIAGKKDGPLNKADTLTGTSGGVAGDSSLHALSSINTGATFWGIALKNAPLPTGGSISGGYGSANVSGGSIALNVHVATDSAKTASDNAKQGQQQLDALKGQAMFAELVKTAKVSTAGNDIVVTAQVPEKAIMQLIPMITGMAGGH